MYAKRKWKMKLEWTTTIILPFYNPSKDYIKHELNYFRFQPSLVDPVEDPPPVFHCMETAQELIDQKLFHILTTIFHQVSVIFNSPFHN
jgi:hypothetical protein